jgi:hypothetical protein
LQQQGRFSTFPSLLRGAEMFPVRGERDDEIRQCEFPCRGTFTCERTLDNGAIH